VTTLHCPSPDVLLSVSLTLYLYLSLSLSLTTPHFNIQALVGLTLQARSPIFERLALVTPCVKPLGVPPIARAAIRYCTAQCVMRAQHGNLAPQDFIRIRAIRHH
jgi:hypothetical protein